MQPQHPETACRCGRDVAPPRVAAGRAVPGGAVGPGRRSTATPSAGSTQTLAKLSLEDRIGQLIAPAFDSTYLPTDSDEFDRLARVMRDSHAGAVIAFGGTEPAPQVLLNPAYGTVVLGQSAGAGRHAQPPAGGRADCRCWPTADFEFGAGMRIAGATRFPRAMALGAAGDEQLAFEAGRITAIEGRAMGVHVNFAPVADVNNNPRNPVINTRSFGEDPARVGALVAAYVRGLQQGGMLATLKHFPGHGDTETDSHLGLPLITHPRDRLDALELPPFRAGLAAGASAVMVAHVELPALDPDKMPATFSRAVVTDLLRRDLAFDGLVVTDAMKMDAIIRMMPRRARPRCAPSRRARISCSTRPIRSRPSRRSRLPSRAGRIDAAESTRRSPACCGRRRASACTARAPWSIASRCHWSVGGRQHQAAARTISERASR